MKMMTDSVIQDWVKKKKHTQDRNNRIEKRLKKYSKQKKHFEFRLKAINEYEKRTRGQIKI